MNSKEKILEAAINLFAEKGKYGARMEDIGKAAKINKAMVYYYYSDRENLFQESLNMIVERTYTRIFLGLLKAKEQNYDPKDMLVQFTSLHFEEFSRNKNWTQLFMNVLHNEPDKLQKAFHHVFAEKSMKVPQLLEMSFREGIATGIFRDVDFLQVFISIIGMNIIYFLGKPIAETILDFNVENEDEFLKKRKESIIDLLLRGIMK